MMAQSLLESVIAITDLPLLSDQTIDLAVIGGGAAGFMGAITAAAEGVDIVSITELLIFLHE